MSLEEQILTGIADIKQLLQRESIAVKEVLTIEEAAIYSGYEERYLKKLTGGANPELQSSKPKGGKVFIKRNHLEQFLSRNAKTPADDIKRMANKLIKDKA